MEGAGDVLWKYSGGFRVLFAREVEVNGTLPKGVLYNPCTRELIIPKGALRVLTRNVVKFSSDGSWDFWWGPGSVAAVRDKHGRQLYPRLRHLMT